MEKQVSVTSFQQLEVWKRAHAFVLATYRMTAQVFPREELYVLTSQLRRSAVSVPASIAEGFSKKSRSEKARFYNIAECSHEESRYYLILSKDLGYTDISEMLSNLDEVGRMLRAYRSAILSSRLSPRNLLLFLTTLF